MSTNYWPELPPDVVAKIESALAGDNKIEAIIIYRQATHSGLKEAKDAIERADAAIPKASSNEIVTRTQGPNWFVIISLLIILGIVAAFILVRMR